MELTCFNANGEYVGSVYIRGAEIPEIVIFARGVEHEAYLLETILGKRSGGIPRYVQQTSVVTGELGIPTARPTAKPPLKKRRR